MVIMTHHNLPGRLHHWRQYRRQWDDIPRHHCPSIATAVRALYLGEISIGPADRNKFERMADEDFDTWCDALGAARRDEESRP